MDSLFLRLKVLIVISLYSKNFNPYFNGFTILTVVISALSKGSPTDFNPYFNGFTILTRTFEKTLYLSMLQDFFQTLK